MVEHWRRTKRPKKNFEKKIATTVARRGGKKWPILSPKLSVKNKMKTNKTRYKMYSWTPKTTLGPVYMEKSCPGQEGHPPTRVNFTERLYEKKVDPSARAKS